MERQCPGDQRGRARRVYPRTLAAREVAVLDVERPLPDGTTYLLFTTGLLRIRPRILELERHVRGGPVSVALVDAVQRCIQRAGGCLGRERGEPVQSRG